MKGKLIKWNAEKAFGFIAPIGGGDHVFIHKTALLNRNRIPQINDIITFSITTDKDGRYCASEANFSGEKLKKKEARKLSTFSIYLPVFFLVGITMAYFIDQFPQKVLFWFFGTSVLTFLAYAFDKSKAQSGGWRTQESTLDFFSLIGGWPGAALAQQLLKHKSQKQEFRIIFWLTVIMNISGLIWLYSSLGSQYINIF